VKTYVLRRILISIPLLIAISFITFSALQLAPGTILDTIRFNPQVSEETVEKLERQYKLDKHWLVQYLYWLKGIAKLDLGYSIRNERPVSQIILSRALNTLLLSVVSMFFIWLIAIPSGIYTAVHQYSFGDKVFSVVSYIGLSLPGFFFALLLLFFADMWGIFPKGQLFSGEYASIGFFGKFWHITKHLLVPVIVISTGSMAVLQRIMRGNMLEVLRTQYLVTARAKGLPEKRVIYGHALRNAVNPMITIFGYQLSGLLSGAALIEMICSYPGLGYTMLDAVRAQDTHLVMGAMLISGVLLVAGNLVADILLVIVDPRIRVH